MQKTINCKYCGHTLRSLDEGYYHYLKAVKEKSEQCRYCGLYQNINFKDIKYEDCCKT